MHALITDIVSGEVPPDAKGQLLQSRLIPLIKSQDQHGGAWLRGYNARLRAKGTEVRVSLEILNSGQILV